jgi:hypothetical protein
MNIRRSHEVTLFPAPTGSDPGLIGGADPVVRPRRRIGCRRRGRLYGY